MIGFECTVDQEIAYVFIPIVDGMTVHGVCCCG